MNPTLPLAGSDQTRAWVWRVIVAQRRTVSAMVALFGAATLAGLVGPRLLGELVESAQRGLDRPRVDLLVLVFVAALAVQALLAGTAGYVAAVLGERLLAEAREDLVRHAVRLPLDVLETAGSGDLLSRATSDVDKLDEGLRQAAPRIVIASITVLLTAVAMVLTAPLLASGMLLAVPVLVASTRWYRPRAIPTYERTLTHWADVHASTHETVDGGRTVEALGLAGRRIALHEDALRRVAAGEHRSGRLWSVFLVGMDVSAAAPLAAILLLGGWAYGRGLVGLGEITAVVLYAQALSEPLNEILGWLDELQIGNAALRRVLGVRAAAPETGDPGAARPDGQRITVRAARFGYRDGHDVLHGIDLEIPAGQRLAVVGPSGAGKSTLGRLLAGIAAPDSGSVTIGGVGVSSLPLARRRREVVLVTQEQHVFAGTVRENLTLPRPATDIELWDALRTAGAATWAAELPAGLDTTIGAGGEPVNAAATQQLALARLLLADPHTLVLDEATSLLEPSASRELERSLAAVLAGRTVISIAHRLHTARDADRIAVLVRGRIVELGTHDELIAAGGSYAELYAASVAPDARAMSPRIRSSDPLAR